MVSPQDPSTDALASRSHGPINSWNRQVYVAGLPGTAGSGGDSASLSDGSRPFKLFDTISHNLIVANYQSAQAVDSDGAHLPRPARDRHHANSAKDLPFPHKQHRKSHSDVKGGMFDLTLIEIHVFFGTLVLFISDGSSYLDVHHNLFAYGTGGLKSDYGGPSSPNPFFRVSVCTARTLNATGQSRVTLSPR